MTRDCRERLRLGPIARDLPRVYAHHWRLLVPLALIVLLPQAIGDALVGTIEIERIQSAADLAKLASAAATSAINLGGEALYAGIAAAAVVHWRRGEQLTHRGRRLRDFRSILDELPLRRLIAVDAILAIGTALGVLLLVVPGIVFYTYLAISPALIEVRRLRLREAFATSFRLVRGSFWRVLAVIGAVVLLTDVATTVLESPLHGLEGEVALNLAIHATLEPFQGLVTVLLALALLDLRSE